MTFILENCPKCGGTHIGSYECPFVSKPCVVCGVDTIFACSDCAINSGGRNSVHVCNKTECRDVHEALIHPDPPTTQEPSYVVDAVKGAQVAPDEIG